ncbi:MAG: hypothetical protein NTV82_08685 [Candidatus Aminicenantes bacterium]|nr:hypothetical protein [Candidatus Aminicenantes bacterium]
MSLKGVWVFMARCWSTHFMRSAGSVFSTFFSAALAGALVCPVAIMTSASAAAMTRNR